MSVFKSYTAFGAFKVPQPVIYLGIIIGQSNGDGRDSNTGLPLKIRNHDYKTRIYYKPGSSTSGAWDAANNVDDGAWWYVGTPHNATTKRTCMCLYGSTSVGPEIHLAYRWEKKYPDDKLALIKFAIGSSDIDQQWLNAGGNFESFLQYVYWPAVDDLQAEGYEVRPAFIYWNQGEADAFDQTEANLYLGNLRALRQRIIAQCGISDARYLISQLGDYTTHGQPWLDVAAAQAQFCAETPDAVLIRTDGTDGTPKVARKSGDAVHYSTAGQSQIAEKIMQHVGPDVHGSLASRWLFNLLDDTTRDALTPTEIRTVDHSSKRGSFVRGVSATSDVFKFIEDDRGARTTQSCMAELVKFDGATAFDIELQLESSDGSYFELFYCATIDETSANVPATGYTLQFRLDASKIVRTYRYDSSTPTQVGTYTYSQGDWDSLGDAKRFRLTLTAAGVHTLYSRASASDAWTQVAQFTDTTYTSGKVYLVQRSGAIGAVYVHSESKGYALSYSAAPDNPAVEFADSIRIATTSATTFSANSYQSLTLTADGVLPGQTVAVKIVGAWPNADFTPGSPFILQENQVSFPIRHNGGGSADFPASAWIVSFNKIP